MRNPHINLMKVRRVVENRLIDRKDHIVLFQNSASITSYPHLKRTSRVVGIILRCNIFLLYKCCLFVATCLTSKINTRDKRQKLRMAFALLSTSDFLLTKLSARQEVTTRIELHTREGFTYKMPRSRFAVTSSISFVLNHNSPLNQVLGTSIRQFAFHRFALS